MDDIKSIISKHKAFDKMFAVFGLVGLFVGLATLLALIVDLAIDGLPRITWHFFTNFPSRFPEKAGILSAWVGTTLVMLVTAAAAVPLGVAAGVYIVYGLMALGLFVYQFNFGQSILTAGLTLALLILPMVIIATRESIRAIPSSIREAAYACGATKWQMVWNHVLPYSTGGILTGVIIALSRAIGESAPLITIGALTFIAFLPTPPVSAEPPFLSFQWLMDAFTVMPIQMFNWVSRPQAEFHLNAAAAGLVLLVMTLLMNGIAIYIRYRFRKRIKW